MKPKWEFETRRAERALVRYQVMQSAPHLQSQLKWSFAMIHQGFLAAILSVLLFPWPWLLIGVAVCLGVSVWGWLRLLRGVDELAVVLGTDRLGALKWMVWSG